MPCGDYAVCVATDRQCLEQKGENSNLKRSIAVHCDKIIMNLKLQAYYD